MGNQNDPWPQFSSSKENSAVTPPPPPLQEPPEDDIPPLKPGNWLWQSILATLFCCIPFGIAGIIYAAKVDTLYFEGKYEDAERAARKAKMWVLIAVGAGLVYFIYLTIMVATGAFSEYMEKIIENNASGYNY